ncbi:Uncharacterized protein TCM_001355 [Theobroma cacao]|uniref:Uncharacterized protein n=1 Tax=Theobroma cacao TaxID=3641 RepID=A0A061DK53_THECC|nr:Uncharacterized protein TCM_001355 [Theobroma cacao]
MVLLPEFYFEPRKLVHTCEHNLVIRDAEKAFASQSGKFSKRVNNEKCMRLVSHRDSASLGGLMIKFKTFNSEAKSQNLLALASQVTRTRSRLVPGISMPNRVLEEWPNC